MKQKTFSSLMTFILVASLVLGGTVPAQAQILDKPVDNPMNAPASALGEPKVPHYFGPYPNWALSPLRLPNVFIELKDGGGSGATAAAEVDPQSGALTAITVTNPGSGYTSAPAVSITGMGTNAAATAVVDYSGVVTKVTVGAAGSGYTAPTVAFSGGGAVTQATGAVYGGV